MPGESVKIFERYLDYSTVKQKLIAKNISNISTINYKREDMSFDDYMRETEKAELKTNTEKQFEFGLNINGNNPEDKAIVKDDNPEMESNFNNVDVDKEMADLARNSIMYKFASRKVGNYYKNLQSVIQRVR
ncbi:MAG TPA: flagellar basal body rod protein FlgB [Melioribacteraceae bacterium]|nr:flagellar basal body rod protein FlgB [Melioribacteraceae bacterium]